MVSLASRAIVLWGILAACNGVAAETVLGESCDLASVGATGKQDFLVFDRELRSALSRQDAAALALLTHFPLQINYANGSKISLNNATALQARFAEVFPRAVRSAVLDQKPQAVFCDNNGIMYGSGEIWVGVAGQGKAQHYGVAVVNLPVGGGRAATLGRRKLEFVCDAEKHRVVIDSDSTGNVRYRAWNKPRFLGDKPDMEIASGTADVSGTGACAKTIWRFTRGDTKFAVSERGCTDGSEPQGTTGRLDVSSAAGMQRRWWCY